MAHVLLTLFGSEGQRSWQSSSHFQKEDGKVAMTSPILLLGRGGVLPWSLSYHYQCEGGKEAMTSALLFLGSEGATGEWVSNP